MSSPSDLRSASETPPVEPSQSTVEPQTPAREPRYGEPGFVDRRTRPTPMLSRYTFFGGRRGAAGGTLDEGAYVDRYSLRSSGLVLTFFSLTVFDAIATVYYIDHIHGTEFNPIAQWMLDQGRVFFVFAKGLPTLLLLLFVMIHKNFRLGRICLASGFLFYLALAVYHLVLQTQALLLALKGQPT